MKKEINSIEITYQIKDKKHTETVKTKKEAHAFINFAYNDLKCDDTQIKFNYK